MADTAPAADSAPLADAMATLTVKSSSSNNTAAAAAAAAVEAPDAAPAPDSAARLPEPLLDENPNRYTMLPIKYPAIWEMYKKAEASFWTGEFFRLRERGACAPRGAAAERRATRFKSKATIERKAGGGALLSSCPAPAHLVSCPGPCRSGLGGVPSEGLGPSRLGAGGEKAGRWGESREGSPLSLSLSAPDG